MNFKNYSGSDLEKWKTLIGGKIGHSNYGVGIIKEVGYSALENGGILLHVDFNGKIRKLNDRGLGRYYHLVSDKNKFKGITKPQSNYSRSNYSNHCWRCKSPIDNTNNRCDKCGWYICPSCGACRCQYGNY